MYAASNSLSLNTPTTNLSNGSEFNVTLRVDSIPSIVGVSTEVKYNATQLSYVSASSYATSFPDLFGQTPDSGVISSARGTGGGGVSGNKVIVTYRFKVLASGGQSILEATGVANGGGSEIPLGKSVLNINIASATAPTNAGVGTPATGSQSTAPVAKPSSVPEVGQTTSGASNNDKPDSLDIGADADSDGETKSATQAVTQSLGKIAEVGRGNKFGLLGIITAVLLIAGGILYGLKIRRTKQNASHFPDLHANIFTETQGNSPIVAPRFTPEVPVAEEPMTNPVPPVPVPPATNTQPFVPSVVDPVVIQPQAVQPISTSPSVQQPITQQTPTASESVIMPEGSIINPDETPKVG